jgi:RNA polymerase sigma-70 factor (ECF subfamily)
MNLAVRGQPQESDEILIGNIRSGDPGAFRFLFEKHYSSVLAYSIAFSGDRALAEDIVQEVFCRVHESLPTLKNPCRFKSWILRLARNLNIDSFRKKKRHQEVSISQPEMLDALSLSEPELVVHQTFEATLNLAELPLLSSLTPGQREIVMLRVIEGLSYQEIAEITGLTPENLRKIMSRTLEQLQTRSPDQ